MTGRAYQSPLREEHARRTRELILESLVAMAADPEVEEVNVAELASRAGVSTRTVYRHFPDRNALLDGLANWLTDKGLWTRRSLQLHDLSDLVELAPQAFAQFEAHPAETRAIVALNPSGRAKISVENQVSFVEAVKASVPELPDRDAQSVAGLLHVLGSSRTWVRLRDEVGLDAEQTSRACSWAVRTLIDALAADRSLEANPSRSP